MRLKRQSIVLTASLLAFACDDSKPPKAPAPKANGSEAANALGDGEGADGEGGADPAGRLNQPAAAPEEVIAISDIDAGEEPTGPLFEASYRLAVVADIFGGVNVCEGTVSLVVNRDFTFTLPTPSLSCAGGLCEVDMKAVMGMLAKPGGGGGIGGLVGGVNSDEKFLSVANVGNMQFDPPRPLALLSPFHFDPISDAIKVNETYSGTVTDTTTGQKASGTLNLKVEEANDDRIRWAMTAQGWEGANKALAMLLARLEMTWSLNPLGVPHIGAFSVIGDMLKATQSGGQSKSPEELAKLCSGATGQVLSVLAGFLPEGGDDSGGFMDTLIEFGKSLIEDVGVGLTLDLINQKVLGQTQEREE